MHIVEGVLSAPVLIGGAAVSAAGVAAGLRGLDNRRILTAAILAAAFFVVSLVHIPVGVSDAHLMLAALLALILGRAAWPAIFVAMLLQVLLLQMGGLTTLGVNLAISALPAVLLAALFRPLLDKSARARFIGSFVCAAFSVAVSGLLMAVVLSLSNQGFWLTARLIFLAHLPVMALDGLVTALAISFIAKVRPEIFDCFRKPARPVQ